jgi:uncharacterized cupredoxin-like copper-binding protein
MKIPHRRFILLIAAACVLGLIASGCGTTTVTKTVTVTTPGSTSTKPQDSDTSKDVAAQAPNLASDQTVNIEAGEMFFKPTSFAVKAGSVKFVLKNTGAVVHELIVLKTDAPINSLKVGSDSRVSEDASVGEVSETDAGATKATVIKLTPGNYLLVCNIPGHYAGGMRATMVVT